jgi:precorrin isomerase
VEERARFAAAEAICANILVFGRKGMPSEVFTRGSGQLVNREPIIVDRNAVQAALTSAPAVTTGLEIVPWKPVRDVIALQLLSAIIESRREARISERIAPAATVIILECPNDPSQPHFDF